MPTYQYACTECDHRFELVQSFTDPSATECPVCGQRVRKVFSPVGVVFKGSGFYRNDAREAARSAAKSAKSESSKSESGQSETKSDSGKSESSKSESSKSESSKSEAKTESKSDSGSK